MKLFGKDRDPLDQGIAAAALILAVIQIIVPDQARLLTAILLGAALVFLTIVPLVKRIRGPLPPLGGCLVQILKGSLVIVLVAAIAVDFTSIFLKGPFDPPPVPPDTEPLVLFDARAWNVRDGKVEPPGYGHEQPVSMLEKGGNSKDAEAAIIFSKSKEGALKVTYHYTGQEYCAARFLLMPGLDLSPYRDGYLQVGIRGSREAESFPSFGLELVQVSRRIGAFYSDKAIQDSQDEAARPELRFPISAQLREDGPRSNNINEILITFSEGYGSPQEGDLHIDYVGILKAPASMRSSQKGGIVR